MTTRPRPILKRLSSVNKVANNALPFAMCGRVISPHVHFPPTPSIVASTHIVHSPQTYDRKPIMVSHNSCELPLRGERRLHSPPANFEVERQECGRDRGRSGGVAHVKGSYFHPRAYEACEPEPFELDGSRIPPPPLLADEDDYESDSDEDEDSVTTPPDPKLPDVSDGVALAATSGYSKPTRSTSPYRTTYAFVSGSRAEGTCADDLQRPVLLRSNSRPLIRTVRFDLHDHLSGIDEGCLGGF